MKVYQEVAIAFASALIDADFNRAHSLLAPALRQELPPRELQNQLYRMFRGYADGDPTQIRFDEDLGNDPVRETWPGKQPGDLGWAYVSIEGDGFNEAVTVTVAEIDGVPLIRDIEWGRP